MRDAAAVVAKSDPLKNQHFSRRWGPPPERKRPRTGDTAQRATFEDGSSGVEDTYGLRLLQAFRLDRLADAELAVGHADHAERLSHAAAELREASR